MVIHLKHKFNKLEKYFSNKKELLSEIDGRRFYEVSNDFEDYRRRNGLPSNYHEWITYDLVDFFYHDYEIIKY